MIPHNIGEKMDDESKLLMAFCTGVIGGLLGLIYDEIRDYSGGILSDIPWNGICMAITAISVLGIVLICIRVVLRMIESGDADNKQE